MKKLRNRFDRFCFRHRDKGIPNLMMYIALGSALVYIINMIDKTYTLYNILCFDRAAILQGQIWRLFTYPLVFDMGGILYTAIGLICYYSLGRASENSWGTFRFNLFYFTGMLLMDIYCMIFGCAASADYLNLSLFLAYATMYPDAQFLFLFIIPVIARIFALLDLLLMVFGLLMYPFPYNLFSVIALANYFLFFGKDVVNVFPMSWRLNARRLFRRGPAKPQKAKTIPFPSAGSYQATVATPKAPYTHKCTVCSRTDVSNPELEFRYCSRCKGYHCYCQDHINNHSHVE